MKYLRLLVMAMLVAQCGFAQRTFLGVYGGVASYNGDLVTRIYPKKATSGIIGIWRTTDITNHFSIKSSLIFTSLKASDLYSDDPDRSARNLSFKTNLFELSTVLEYNLLDMDEYSFSPYVFAGLAVFKYNPYSYDVNGNKVYLQPLSTEGQGLQNYPDRNPYKLIQGAVPFGGGIKLDVNDRFRLGFEVGLRKLFTDYFDDVSKTYVDYDQLLNSKNPIAVEMAYRTDELNRGATNSSLSYPSEGEQRGDPTSRDTYYFTGLHLSYRLIVPDARYFHIGKFSNRHTHTKCPTLY